MAYGKLNNDGTLSSANKQHEGFVSLGLFETKEDGSYYTYYLSEMVDGMYVPDMKLENADIEAEAIKQAKIAKSKALDELVVTHNTVAYDADGRAIGNMSAVMGVANFKYNQAVASGVNPAEAYQLIYKDTKIWWKGADNEPHEVMIESVCEALEKSMNGVSDILGL